MTPEQEKWTITSLSDLENLNSRHGYHFFEPASMRFFRSRIGNVIPLPYGALFITSEQFKGSDGHCAPRYYTIRHMLPDGHVETIGGHSAGFQAFNNSATANRHARKIAAWCKEGVSHA